MAVGLHLQRRKGEGIVTGYFLGFGILECKFLAP